MRDERLSELSKGVDSARRIAVIANTLYKLKLKVNPRYLPRETFDSTAVEILLKLFTAGGKATLTSLTVRNADQAFAILEEMEKSNLVKILKTPFRTYVVLTDRGKRVIEELLNIVA